MNLSDVLEGLVEERGLDKELVASIMCEGISLAYRRKYPDFDFNVTFNKKSGTLDVFTDKEVVTQPTDEDYEISLRKAKAIDPKAEIGDMIAVPFTQPIGRIEILAAKQFIAGKIRELELLAVYNEFKDKKDTIITGTVHKKERAGWVIKVGEVLGLLPVENLNETEVIKIGHQIKVLLADVLSIVRGDNYQLVFDRASATFVKKLLELEIPEVFEGVVEIKNIVRIAGYKSKVIVSSSSKEIDPVGTCVGVGGSRIKPILRELGQEKIDLIEWTDSLEDLVRDSLKPAEIDKVIIQDNKKAIVLLAEDQRSFAIGKAGQNISLASKLTGLEIQLQDITPEHQKDADMQEEEELELN